MHEFAIARALVDLACEQARAAGLSRVSRVNCRVGVLRQIEPDMLRDAFDVARTDTACEAAALGIESVALRAKCPHCRRAFTVESWDWQCPDCGTVGEPAGGGDELELTSIEGRVACGTAAST